MAPPTRPTRATPSTPTLQSVADRVGVSRTTVSNAYNRPDQLSPALRARILAAADELGYGGPDAAARMLRTGRRHAVGLVFTEDLRYVFHDPNTAAFLQGVAETLASASSALVLLPVPAGVDRDHSAVLQTPVDGYVVFSVPTDHPVLALLSTRGVPVVCVDEPDLGPGHWYVGIDDARGAAASAAHLVSLGHRRVGIVLARLDRTPRTGVVDDDRLAAATVRVAVDRCRAWLDTLASHGIPRDDVVIWEGWGSDPDAGREAAGQLLDAHPDRTALLCFSDQVAVGALQAAFVRRRRVPADLSLVGFDDAPCATAWTPALTTVRQPLVAKGEVAAALLLEAVTGAAPRRVDLPVELVVRTSTAVAADAGERS